MKKLGKYDKVCKKCAKVIKGAVAETRGESSCEVVWPKKDKGWYHFNCYYGGTK